jgi:hypothetical protein
MDEFTLSNEIKIIALLSGYVRELSEGRSYEQTTYDLASGIDRMYKNQIKQAISTCLKPSGFDLQQFKEILGIE